MKQHSIAYEKMRQSLEQFNPINNKDWELFTKQLKVKTFKKGELFVREGQQCNHLGFLNEGIARVYYTIDGKEITSYFNAGNRNVFVCSFTSFLSRKPSFEIIHF